MYWVAITYSGNDGGNDMDFGFYQRILELQRTCPLDWAIYVTRPLEMPGAAPKDEVAKTDIILGSVGDDVATLYQAWVA